jgi:hypothetical protein
MLDRTDPLDARIDAVACQKSAGELRPDLRQRVLFRIAGMETTRPKRSRAMWHGSLAAAAVVALILGVAIITHIRQATAPVSSVAGPPPPPFRHGEPATTAATTPSSAAPGRRLRARNGPAGPPTNEAIARLSVDPISVQPITELPIDVPQNPPPDALALTPLSISPLSPEGER